MAGAVYMVIVGLSSFETVDSTGSNGRLGFNELADCPARSTGLQTGLKVGALRANGSCENWGASDNFTEAQMEEIFSLVAALLGLLRHWQPFLSGALNGEKWRRRHRNRPYSFRLAIQVSAGQIGPNGLFIKVMLLAKRN